MFFYGCGSNGNFQLGLSHDEDLDEFQTIELPRNPAKIDQHYQVDNITDITSGGNHTTVLFDDGSVYMTIHEVYRKEYTEGIVENLSWICLNNNQEISRVKHICSYWDSAILVNDQNRIFKINEEKPNSSERIFFPSNSGPFNIVEIRGCMNHFILKTIDGQFYGWGNNKRGKLVSLSKKDSLGSQKMTMININKDIDSDFHDVERSKIQFCVGKDYSVYYNEKKILIKGKAETIIDQITKYVENDENKPFFKVIRLRQDKEVHKCLIVLASKSNNCIIKQIQSMWTSIHILLEKSDGRNSLISFGNNTHKQLLTGVEDVENYKVGSEHGLIIFKSKPGTVYSWGWGEHGNCGKKQNGLNDDSHILQEMLQVTGRRCAKDGNPGKTESRQSRTPKIQLVHCGCATSFIAM